MLELNYYCQKIKKYKLVLRPNPIYSTFLNQQANMKSAIISVKRLNFSVELVLSGNIIKIKKLVLNYFVIYSLHKYPIGP